MFSKCTSIGFKTKFSFLINTCEINIAISKISKGITRNHYFQFQLKFGNCLKNVLQMYKYKLKTKFSFLIK